MAAFTAAPLRDPQPFLAPKPLDLLVIDDPALATGVVIGGPEPAARMIFRVLAQPGPQGSVRMVRSDRDGLMTLGGAVLPGHPAGEPFTDPQHPLQMTNGRPPAFRA